MAKNKKPKAAAKAAPDKTTAAEGGVAAEQSQAKPVSETEQPEPLRASSGIDTPGVELPAAGTQAATSEQMDVTGGERAATNSTAFVDIAFPLPSGIPDEALKAASIVVKAKSERGRWRAGRKFTREESVFSFGALTEAEMEALQGDGDLIVSLRVPKPA